jgi:hypothetical protein
MSAPRKYDQEIRERAVRMYRALDPGLTPFLLISAALEPGVTPSAT